MQPIVVAEPKICAENLAPILLGINRCMPWWQCAMLHTDMRMAEMYMLPDCSTGDASWTAWS